MKHLIALTIILSFALAQSLETIEVPMNKGFEATIALSLSGSDEVIALNLAKDSSDLSVQVGASKQTLPFTYLQDTLPTPMLIGDFNFDGFSDLAIAETEGYGGVNYFYQLYVYTENGFEALSLPEVEFACNPYLEAETKTIKTSCKSGPMYYQQDFRFADGKPYISLETGTIEIDALSAESMFWRQDEFDASGKKIASSITGEPNEGLAATGSVVWDKLYLFSTPDKASRSERYLSKGDQVEVLGLSEDNLWVNIAYQNDQGERQTAWVKPLNISLY